MATVLDFTEGRARQFAEDARTLTVVPELESELCSGLVGQDTVRALARTVKATRKTSLDALEQARETLRIALEKGVKAAGEQVRALDEERTDPGSIKDGTPSNANVPSPGSVLRWTGRCVASRS